MNHRSLRFRLAVWYFASVAAISAIAGVGYWFAVRAALTHALDQGLRYRLVGLRDVLGDVAPGERAIADKLAEISRLGELYQVFDAQGALIAQSNGLVRHDVPRRPPPGVGTDIHYSDGGTADFPLRLASIRAPIGGRVLILGVADPQRKFDGVQHAFTVVLLLSTPLVLAAATAGGLWIGRRALAPVSRITEDARAISERTLSARLAVPESRDELQRLSETLNDMLDRIERSFVRTRQFTADASHELRAPLTLIHTAAEFSLRRERSREELVEGMQKILRESQRTTTLIDDLLRLARGDAGQEAASFDEIDAAPILRDVFAQATAMAVDRTLDVRLDLPPDALPVRAHPARLRQLLLILADNALKYTPAGGRVTLSGQRDGADVTLAVADTGSGIAPDDLPHVFERFWRADRVRTRDVGGTGLGLAIARQIATQHQAALDVRSEPGRGTAFTLRLPGAAGPAARRGVDTHEAE